MKTPGGMTEQLRQQIRSERKWIACLLLIVSAIFFAGFMLGAVVVLSFRK